MNNEQREIVPCSLQIKSYIGCGLCYKEKPDDTSQEEWARISVGATPWGIQIWCLRHDANICHIDFEGISHPANTQIESMIN